MRQCGRALINGRVAKIGMSVEERPFMPRRVWKSGHSWPRYGRRVMDAALKRRSSTVPPRPEVILSG